ncbi:fimbrial family protein [Pseudomonas aeruginosa]|nr:fimbrial family protein [Pseudomonas aeruginosa]
MTLLANENSAGGSNAEATGWYPAIGGATQANGGSGGIDLYRETFRARLEKLALGSQPGVTAGRVEATAQVVIRVQ